MKKLIFTLSLFCLVAISAHAQSCYISGGGVCSPSLVYDTPGLYPISANLAPIPSGKDSDLTIYFVNYDSIANPVTGALAHMDSLQVDSIGNLPKGYCWATSSATDRFYNKTKGCIKINATPGAVQACGQYQLLILVTVWTTPPLLGQNPTGPIPASAAGLYYYVRVNGADDTTAHAVDTSGQAAGTNSFVGYSCTVGINSLDENVTSLKVYPNPFSTQTMVTFNSSIAGAFSEKLTDILGNTIFSKQMDVTYGANSHTINRSGLSEGVYFYTISDGSNSLTKKLVITE